MKIDIRNIGEGGRKIDMRIPRSRLQVKDEFEVTEDVSVEGTVEKVNGEIICNLNFETAVLMPCSRCLRETIIQLAEKFRTVIALERHSEEAEESEEEEFDAAAEDDRHKFLDGDRLDINRVVLEQVYLSLPMKPLCREDCRGLCTVCGRNLNEGECDCDRTTVDPRLKILEKLKKNKIDEKKKDND